MTTKQQDKQRTPMNAQECYLDKRLVIENAMGNAYAEIAKAIEDDEENYALDTDALTELVYEFMEIYIKT